MRLAEWWQTVIARDRFSYSIITWIMNYFSRSPLDTSDSIEKHEKRPSENPEYSDMQHGDVILTLQWHHGSTCDQRSADVRLFFFYLSQGLVRVCEINRIYHWCPVGTGKSQHKGPPFQWEMKHAKFPTERWTQGLGFFWTTEQYWLISFLIYQFYI